MEDKNDKKQTFVGLRAKGNSYDRIARELKVSKTTLITWSRELSDQITNHVSIETDALLEKHKIAKAHQLELYGEQLGKVRRELEKRDLSDVPTDKLLGMELKLLSAINTAGVVRFSETGMFLELPTTRWEA